MPKMKPGAKILNHKKLNFETKVLSNFSCLFERLFNELKERLLIHEHAEEEAFYKPLKETSVLDDDIEESEEEHEETQSLLQQLTDSELVGEEWYDVFLELKEEIEAHIEEEEDEIFEKARDVLSTTDAQDMEDDMKNQARHERENEHFTKRETA